MSLNVELLRTSFDLVVKREPQFTKRFYEVLFQKHPQAMPLFGRNAPEKQQEMLTETLVAVMDHLEDADWLAQTLKGMGAKHVEYRVTDDMYPWVGDALVTTIAEVAGENWNDELARAWTDAYAAISGLMIAGAADARATA